ncbi:hypothetical protein [Paludibacterium yongneupense]|uniref:hypothetical protein n=1 Tax=Paludibacterium yongneupense TaxID=400061 RepID=UPI0003FA8A00|nr:hypothetical protein [Paludibacterium yongneupense]
MSLFPLSGLFAAWLALAWLHGLWRLMASRDGNAQACYVAGFFMVAVTVRAVLPHEALTPVWLPFFYSYAVSGAAAMLWSISALRADRHGVRFVGTEPELAGYFAAVLCLHVGIAATTALGRGKALALYIMLPPLMTALVYLLYRVYAALLRRNGHLGWLALAVGTLAMPLAAIELARVMVPAILRYF